MNQKTRFLTQGALLAALYVAMCYGQDLLIPNSAVWRIQFRTAEALGVLALFTPAAIPGLALGCLLFNISYGGALPLDFVLGSFATLLAGWTTYRFRNITIKGFPLLSFLMPVVANALIIGWELSFYVGGGFFINAISVAIGQAAVLFTLGTVLFYVIKGHRLERLFRS